MAIPRVGNCHPGMCAIDRSTGLLHLWPLARKLGVWPHEPVQNSNLCVELFGGSRVREDTRNQGGEIRDCNSSLSGLLPEINVQAVAKENLFKLQPTLQFRSSSLNGGLRSFSSGMHPKKSLIVRNSIAHRLMALKSSEQFRVYRNSWRVCPI